MDWVLNALAASGSWLRPHVADLALALVASLLVIAGGDINKWLKKQMSGFNFFIRMTLFVVICTFGYGALTVLLTNLLRTQLYSLTNSHLAIAIICGFFALGLYAERKRQI
jgi:hypothetical protein